MKKYYLSSPKMTVQVNTEDGIIRRAAPIVRKFLGQPLGNLLRWMKPDVVEVLNEPQIVTKKTENS